MTDVPDSEPDMTAAEFALGVLGPEERVRAALRIGSDAAFAADVAAWEARLAPLAAEVAHHSPSAAVWPRIAAGLGQAPGLWNSAGFWRGATAAAAAVAVIGLALSPLTRPAPPAPTPAPAPAATLIAALAPEPGKPAIVVAALDQNTGELILTPVALDIDQGKSPELWVIPEGQKAISLGVIDVAMPTRMPTPTYLSAANRKGAVLAITVEQLGGSPTGVAQGPIIGAGGFTES